MEKGKQSVLTIFLDDDVVNGLDVLCAPWGCTREEMVGEIISEVVRGEDSMGLQ